MTPLKAIRLRCLDCCGYQVKEVRMCPCKDCALWPFRFGRNPNRTGLVNNGAFKKNNGSQKDSGATAVSKGKDTTHPTRKGE